jgi:hypothetical protein
MTGRPAPDYVPEDYRAEWGGEAPSPIPELLIDPTEAFPPLPRHETIREENRRTLASVRERVLGGPG